MIPDQKYCERHVHRGRVRSRKPVEVDNNIFLKSKSKSTTSNLLAHAKTNHTKVSIKKHSMDIVQHGNGMFTLTVKLIVVTGFPAYGICFV